MDDDQIPSSYVVKAVGPRTRSGEAGTVEALTRGGDRIVTSDADDIDHLLRTHAANHSCVVVPV
jgi:hypothetical protein